MLTMFEDIEKLKSEWTDKYVVVTGNRPELARFDGYTGQVKTVNMSGRGLVQFDAWNNIGWYDIDVEFLKQVPKPDPSMAGKRAETATTKAAPTKAAVPAKEAGGKKAAPAKAGKRPSVPDILAACRANTPPAGKAPTVGSAGGEEGAAVKEKAAPKAKGAKAAAPAKSGGGSGMSQAALVKLPTPEKIAYCRKVDAG